MIKEDSSEMVDGNEIVDEPPPKKTMHDCPKCSRSFANIGHMKCHFYRVHPEFKLTEFVKCEIPTTTKVCRQCGAGFETQRELKQHDCPGSEENSKTQVYLCAHCDQKFANKTSLQLHCMRQHRKGAKHECLVCKKGFASAPNLAAHMRLHATKGEEKPISTKEVYDTASNDDNGVPEKKEEVPLPPPPPAFQCEKCGEGFKTARSLKSHASTHEEAPTLSFPCTACDEVFTDQASLKEHRHEVHPVEKTIPCNSCDLLFASNQALATHKRIHEGSRSHECDICETRFSTKGMLIAHKKKHSSKKKKFVCAVCDKKFPLKCHLSRHLTTHN